MKKENTLIEENSLEIESYSDDSLFNITSFGNDIMLNQLVFMYDEGDIEKPELQRKYVWTKLEASRFIDSILLGLPVPSIFLAKTENSKLLIVDGYQRIMTIHDYLKGIPFSGENNVFKLSDSDVINALWRGKSYNELSDSQKRSIRTYTIHAIVFEQKHPRNDTGMYQIFERINTGGRTLKPQEIRNCIYHGSFNDLLMNLNKESVWREIIGPTEDSRMADVELILRFFAFNDLSNRQEYTQGQINLTKYLNDYMSDYSNITSIEIEKKRKQFINVINYLHYSIGAEVFRNATLKNGKITWANKINPVVFDSVCTATVKSLNSFEINSINPRCMFEKYKQLVLDDEYKAIIKQRTTNIENIKSRVSFAAKVLFGVEI